MIRLSNGHEFTFMAASGALGFDGKGWPWERPLKLLGLLEPRLFTVVTKTLTRFPRRGNLRWYAPWRAVRFVPDGTVNAIALTNPGIEHWCQKVYPTVDTRQSLVVSIAPENALEGLEILSVLNPLFIKGVEVNVSCPNTRNGMLPDADTVATWFRLMRSVTQHPLLVKVGVGQDYCSIVKMTAGIAEAVSINSIPWERCFPDKTSPLKKYGGGGVSGKAVQYHTWEMIQELVSASNTPVIAPSVWEYEDIAKLFAFGARAISFGSIFLRYPWRPTRFVRQFMREQETNQK